jgi:hypothetical protein
MIPLSSGTAVFGAALTAERTVPRGPASAVSAGPPVALAAAFAGLAVGRDEWVYAFPILYPLSFLWLGWSLLTGGLRTGRASP